MIILENLTGSYILIEDEMADRFYKMWQTLSSDKIVKEVLKNVTFWGKDLSLLPGFEQSVTDKLSSIFSNGMKATLKNVHPKKIFV